MFIMLNVVGAGSCDVRVGYQWRCNVIHSVSIPVEEESWRGAHGRLFTSRVVDVGDWSRLGAEICIVDLRLRLRLQIILRVDRRWRCVQLQAC